MWLGCVGKIVCLECAGKNVAVWLDCMSKNVWVRMCVVGMCVRVRIRVGMCGQGCVWLECVGKNVCGWTVWVRMCG